MILVFIWYVQITHKEHIEYYVQETIPCIEHWSQQHGFRFSHQKTQLIIFQHHRKILQIPPLTLNNCPIPSVRTVKFLGLTFDSRLSWLPRIKNTKVKCIRALNILKYLSNSCTGCNRLILLQLYKALIRPILDYGSPIYGLAPPSYLKLLDTIQFQSSSIRIATGAFSTSSAPSLCAEAGVPPLSYRR